jgi:hypothetical protein
MEDNLSKVFDGEAVAAFLLDDEPKIVIKRDYRSIHHLTVEKARNLIDELEDAVSAIEALQ